MTTTIRTSLVEALASIVGSRFAGQVEDPSTLLDAAGPLSQPPRADAWVRPKTPGEVAGVLAWCYERGVAVTPRGGATGLSGGAVPLSGGVVIALDRLTRVGGVDHRRWLLDVGAGVTTAHVHRLARENGLNFPPDPGAAEQSQIGGNIATNAGGPHALKYGATRAWVTGIEAVLAPGELVRLGAPVRKDSSELDLKSLLVGSEGTLGIITGALVRLTPAPEERVGGLALFADARAGATAVGDLLASGVLPAAVEYFDAATLALVAATCPVELPTGTAFGLLIEVDGRAGEAAREWREVEDALAGSSSAVLRAGTAGELQRLWDWRHSFPGVVMTLRGGFRSGDVVVPVDQLADALQRTGEIGREYGLRTCSFGHGGDGNLHPAFMIDPRDAGEIERAHRAADALADMALELGGTVSGEHGIGSLKARFMARQCSPAVLRAQAAVRLALDPKLLLNPGKKVLPAPEARGDPIPSIAS
jgi:glycolate oxidase subunit GlcD